MIDYATILPGDKLRIVGMGAPGFAKLGDIVVVSSCNMMNRCDVKRADGEMAYFALTCGAQRLEFVERASPPPTDHARSVLTPVSREQRGEEA